ncbi:Cdc6/Cdc18 family protein [Haloarcula nitratireducens]|uniref:AAA family ATPase n=1 Tax=Haloarcula nitratireducens TaxID=2487749 RepID=A0AAW4PH02_9EURY|nr:AAA family ATPase [Halomicroarcula nitratireducens]MBX0297214.1 AAA family ATPase [Halomicroarcula nitratireducens]
MSLFDANTEIYRRRGGLPAEEVDAAIERKQEYEELKTALQQTVAEGEEISFVVGPEGSGKTTLVRRGLDEIGDRENFTTIIIDCASAETLYRTLVRTVNEFRSDENTLSETGYTFDRVRMTLETEIASRAEPTVLVFDSIDALDSVDALGELARQNNTGVVGIADDAKMADQLGGDAWPAHSVVGFHQYTMAELRSLLEEWTETSLSNQPIAPEVIPLCAAYGSERDGDAQYALQLLREGTAIASNERADRVRGRHIQSAKESTERVEIEERISKLDTQSRLVLYSLLELGAGGELPVRTARVYEEYSSTLSSTAGLETEPRSKRRIQERLNRLIDTELVEYTAHNEGRGNGAYREYDLARDREILRSVLADKLQAGSPSVSGLF